MKLTTSISLILLLMPFNFQALSGRAYIPVERIQYNVLDYDIKNDSSTLNTEKIQNLIDHVSENGGGVLYFPAGNYVTGTIYLKNDITLHISNGACILGSLDVNDFDAVGIEKPNHSARQQRHLIYASGVKNIALIGYGEINGRGEEFWPDNYRNMSEIEIRSSMTDENGFSSRPGSYVVFDRCENLSIENLTFAHSPHHLMYILNSSNVQLKGIKLKQGMFEDDGPNTDGLAISGHNFRISDCSFSTGDDCLVIGETSHLALTNCTFSTSESAVVINGLRNGVISNCSFYEVGTVFNFRPSRGGLVENVLINNINSKIDRKRGGTLVFARSKPAGEIRNTVKTWADKWNINIEPENKPAPIIRNISFSNVKAELDGAIFIDGLEEQYVENISFENLRLFVRGDQEKAEKSANPPHPYYIFGHHGAPYGMFFRYVKGITLDDVELVWNKPEEPVWGSPLRIINAENIDIKGFKGRQSLGSGNAAIEFNNVKNANVHACYAPQGTDTFIDLSQCSDVVLLNNNALHSKRFIDTNDTLKIHKNGNIITGD